MKLIPVGKSHFAKVDDRDFKRVSSRSWYYADGYAMTSQRHGKFNKKWSMHVEILKPRKGQRIDHKDRDPLNNQRSNIRFCTQSQNLANRTTGKKSRIGFKGVDKAAGCARWTARVSFRGVKYYLGIFKTEVEAAIAYNKKAKVLFGEFFVPNEILDMT